MEDHEEKTTHKPLLHNPAARLMWIIGIVVVAALVWWSPWQTAQQTPIELKPAEQEKPAGFVLTSQRVDDAIRLSWTALDGADAYDIILFSPDLGSLGRIRTQSNEYLLTASDLAQAVATGTTLVWRIAVLSGEDVVMTSGPEQAKAPW